MSVILAQVVALCSFTPAISYSDQALLMSSSISLSRALKSSTVQSNVDTIQIFIGLFLYLNNAQILHCLMIRCEYSKVPPSC